MFTQKKISLEIICYTEKKSRKTGKDSKGQVCMLPLQLYLSSLAKEQEK